MLLSNKYRYALLRACRLLRAPVYSLLSLFVNKNENIIITASFNMEFSDNARALFEELIGRDEYRERVFFVMNDEVKREDLNRQYPGCFISNSGFRNALFILRAKYWFCSAMELPLATFFQRRVRKVTHLGHGMLYKKVGVSEAQVGWYKKFYFYLVNSSFTYTIATSEFCRGDISAGFGMPHSRIIITPQPKTSLVAAPVKVAEPILIGSGAIHLLYAPTWRPYAAVKLMPFSDFNMQELSVFLIENNVHVWLRVHPRFEQDIDSGLLACENVHLFSSRNYPEINSYLEYFDALITDYSSIYYDFLTLERPVLFFDYDFEKYCDVVGVIDRYRDVKCTGTTRTQKQFLKQALAIKKGEFSLEAVKRVNALVNYPIANEKIPVVMLEKLLSAGQLG